MLQCILSMVYYDRQQIETNFGFGFDLSKTFLPIYICKSRYNNKSFSLYYLEWYGGSDTAISYRQCCCE